MQYDRPLSAIVPGSAFSSSIPSRVATNVLCITIGPSAPSCPDSRFGSPIPSRTATTVLCSTIGPSAPSYPAHVQLVHPFQGGDERLMHHDRPLSAIVSRFTVRLAHSLQDGDDHLMQYDRPLSAIVPSSRSARPSLPGWRRTSYASRSAPQRHRVQIHGSARPFPPGWRRPSYAVRSAPSAPSYPAHVQLVHPFQGGDERLMHHDRPLSTIVSRFTVRLAHSLQDGDDRLMQYDRPLSAIVPSSR
ncbi:unnamed protein product [Cuscuta epithymum]|uniref:Uncharacterized protein n=1 Tax=Cuscuta epithymum TaxID=186058 RepID=A0AAV0D7T9_9ASTE|nr:unnamed protein product [Cuscuta epithymum]